MWLPKDERILLALYFRKIGKPDKSETFGDSDESFNDDVKALGWMERKGSNNDNYEDYATRVFNTDETLEKRGLIRIINRDNWERNISLTMQGYDLGRKYSSWWICSGLWFAEYKDHWFWLILSFLGGVIGAVSINWFSKSFGAK